MATDPLLLLLNCCDFQGPHPQVLLFSLISLPCPIIYKPIKIISWVNRGC